MKKLQMGNPGSQQGKYAPNLPRWLWLWTPILYLLLESAVAVSDRRGIYERIFMHEAGFVEIATAVLLLPALILGMRRAVQLWRNRSFRAACLMSVFALGCLFLLGEEISYGQHVFGWETPEYFDAHNTQRETNLHNLEFVNKARMKWLMLLGMLVVGIILPLTFRRYGVPVWIARSGLHQVLIGSLACLPTVLVAIGMHLLVKTFHWLYEFEFHDNGFIDMRETTELYISYFLVLYSLALFRSGGLSMRLRAQEGASGALSDLSGS